MIAGQIETRKEIELALDALLEIPVSQRDQAVSEQIAVFLNLLQSGSGQHNDKNISTFQYEASSALLDSSSPSEEIIHNVLEQTIISYDELRLSAPIFDDDRATILPNAPSPQPAPDVILPETVTLKTITSESMLTLNNPTPEAYDSFGISVSSSENYAVIGAAYDNTNATGAGSAYIYDLTTNTVLYTLNNPAPEANDSFGAAVSIDGNYAVIGAHYDNENATSTGSAYVYDVSTGNLLYTLNNPRPGAFDLFGSTVYVNGDYVVIGSPSDNTGANNSGAAYIYDVSTGNLLHTLDNPTIAATDSFGHSISGDGDHIIISAYRDSTNATTAGSAYIYDASTGALLHTLNNPTPLNYEYFGYSVSIEGDYALVGARDARTGSTTAIGEAYVYDVTTGNLLHTLENPDPSDGNRFGNAVAVGGHYALVAESEANTGSNYHGAVHIFDLTTGDLLYTIDNPAFTNYDLFGNSVSIDGDTAIIGSYNDNTGATSAGSAYVFFGDFDGDGNVRGTSADETLYGFDGDDILSGLGGNDTLYGGDGADTFSFEGQGTTDFDRIEDFTVGDGDKLDISDIITGFNGSSDIEDFARIIDDTVNIGHSYLVVDGNGAADGQLDFVAVAYIVNGAGLDISTLYDNGQIIAF